MGMFWLVIAFFQIGISGEYLAGGWNILASIVNLYLIRGVVKRSRKVVNALIFLGIVGGIWGVYQLLNGTWIQAIAIPMYIVLAILAQVNKENFTN